MPGQDEYSNLINITSSKKYDFRGNVIEETAANNNVTRFVYTPKGDLEKIIMTTELDGVTTEYITAFAYDVAGRKTIEVTPKNYDNSKQLTQVNRVD